MGANGRHFQKDAADLADVVGLEAELRAANKANAERLAAINAKGMTVDVNMTYLLTYLEVLLGPRLLQAKLIGARNVGKQLDAAEDQVAAIELELEKQAQAERDAAARRRLTGI